MSIYRLGWQSLGFDEGFVVWIAKMPLADGLRYLAGDEHPPLHYVLIHYWIGLAGSSEFSLRFSSVLASIPVLPLTYRIGTQLGGRRVGLLSTLVIVSNGLWVFYAHQARMYPLASTLALLTLYLLLLTLDGPRRSRRVWIALTAAAGLTLYTVYYSFFVLLGAAAYIAARLWTTERSPASFRRRLLPYLAVVGVTALSFLPWLPAVIGQLGAGVNPAWRAFVPASTLLARTLNALALGHTTNARPDVWGWPPKAALALVIVAGCLSLLAASHRRNSERRPVVASLTLIFVPLAAVYVISLWKPIYNDRYVVVLLPAFALLLAALLTSLSRRSTALFIVATSAVVAASLTSVYNFYFDQRYAWDDYRSAVSYVREHLWPDDILLLTSANSYPIFDYYFQQTVSWRGPLQQFNPQQDRRNGPPIVQIGSINEARAMLSYPDDYPQTAAEAQSRLQNVAGSAGRLWLVRFLDTITDPAAVVPDWADRSMLEVDHQWFAGPSSLQAYAYATRRPPAYGLPDGVNSLDAKFNNGASLVGYELKPVDPKPGETALLTLYWRCDRPITQDYQVAVRLRDVAGSDLAQHDSTPLSGLRPTVVWQRGEIIRDDHPIKLPETLRRPGVYRLAVGMYRPGRKMSLVPLEGGGSTDLALVADLVEHPAPVQVAAPERVLASFGSSIVLQGYRLVPSPVTPADSLEVALLWKAVAPPAESYKVFVHLLDASGNIVSQQDDEPLRGAFPTSKWATGDVVEDKHTISLSPAAPAGAYSLAVGLYSASTGRRLEVSGTSDARFILAPVDLRGGV